MQAQNVQYDETPAERALVDGLSESQKIRLVLKEMGRKATLDEIVDACIAADVWSMDDQEHFIRREMWRRVSSVLRDKRVTKG